MKKLIYTATLTLTLASLIPAAYATEIGKTTHLIHSNAHTLNSRIPNATHHFELYIAGKSLSELAIDLPEGISVTGGIKVTDQSGRKLETTVALEDKTAKVAFAQPVASGTILSIEINGVNISSMYRGRTFHYPIRAKINGFTVDIPIGTARIQTYD